MRRILITTTAALALAACGQRSSNGTPVGNGATTGAAENVTGETVIAADESNVAAAAASTGDRFALDAARSDMYEILSSKLAVEKSSDAGIKKFAQMMVDGHAQTTRELKAATATDNVSLAAQPELDPKRQALIAALTAAPAGDTFNQLYKAQQRDAHKQTLATMEAFAVSTDSPALAKFAAATAPKVKQHLDMVNALK